MTEQTSAVGEAERIVAELKEAAALIEKRQQEIEAERRALSYSVLVEKDAGAIKKMTALVIEANKQADAAETCMAAREESERRLSIAQSATAAADDRERGLQIRAVLTEFLEASLSLDEALVAIGEEGAALFAAVNKLHALGVTHPTDAQLRVLGLQALQTALMSTPWHKDFPHLAPRERRSWASLARTWVANIETNNVKPALCEDEPAKEVETVP
jgi:hypothetical protein